MFFLQLSSAQAVSKEYKHEPVHTNLSGARWRYMLDVPFGTSPDLLYIGFQQHSDYFIGGACHRMSVSVEMFSLGRSDTLKHYCLEDFVRYLKCIALWRFISSCEYIISQWGPLGNLIYVKLWKGAHLQGWKWERGQQFTSFHEFRYSKNRLPRTNDGQLFALLKV